MPHSTTMSVAHEVLAFRARRWRAATTILQTLCVTASAIGLTACVSRPVPSQSPVVQSLPEPAPLVSTVGASANSLRKLAQGSGRVIVAPIVRVGLLTDESEVVFRRIEGGYVVVAPEGSWAINRGFRVQGPLAGMAVSYAVQAGAISDRTSADALREKLSKDSGLNATSRFDAATGTYKVLVGAFESSEASEPLRSRLIAAGYPREIMTVRRPAEQRFEKRIRLVDDEGDERVFSSDSLLLLPVVGEAIEIGGQPYRGGARLVINSRGQLNVVNELNLEDYVRGVVPNEMGPRIYDELEALKAQSLAARTYAVKRLGDYASEGYDICATPACQVYKGKGTEDPLSDRAVAETGGMVITYGGEPIDALYTSTCGGETSDVGTMFPGRSEPYLKRAECVELVMTTLSGRQDSGVLTDQQTDSRLFAAVVGLRPDLTSWTAAQATEAISAAAKYAGVRLSSATPPRSSSRGEILTYLASAWNLADAARTLTLPEDRKYFFPSADVDSAPYLAATILTKYRFVPAQYLDRVDLGSAMPRDELHSILFSWLRKQDAIREAAGKIAGVNGRVVTIQTEGKKSPFTLPEQTPVFRKISDRSQEYQGLPVMNGDRASILQDRGGRVLGVIVTANYDGAAFDRTSSYSSWTRSHRADDLAVAISRRNPIRELVDLRPLSTDPSKRVTEMEVTADEGRKFVLRGLPIRWSLNVPDNLFVMNRSVDSDGVARFTFYGKGWGHGTGMCQAGAFGMAFRGRTAEQIIRNYYTGVEIVRMSTLKSR